MANKCVQDNLVAPLNSGTTAWRLSEVDLDSYAKRLEQMVGETRARGLDPNELVKNADGQLVPLRQAILDDLLRAEVQNIGDVAIDRFTRAVKESRLSADIEKGAARFAKGKPVTEAHRLRALRDLVSTGETLATATPSLERRQGVTMAKYFGQKFLAEVNRHVGDGQRLMLDEVFMARVMREFYNRDPAKAITGDVKAKQFADILYGALEGMRERINWHGGRLSKASNLFSPTLEWRRIQAEGRSAFVERMTKWLSPRYGDETVRAKHADDIYSELENHRGLIDWDNIGLPDLDAGKGLVKGTTATASRHMEFVDGEAWNAFNQSYGNSNFSNMIFRRFDHLSRKLAATEMFGGNYASRYGNTLLDNMLEGITRGNGKLEGHSMVRRIKYDYEKLTMFSGTSSPVVTALLSGVRSYTVASKLGSAILSNILDMPSMIMVAKTLYGSDAWQAIQTATGKFSQPQQVKDYARHLGIALDSFNSAVAGSTYRFTADPLLSGSMGNTRTERFASAVQNSGAKVADTVMKFSFMNWWQDSGRVAAARLAGAMLHDHIAANRAWSELPAMYRNSLVRNGFDEGKWRNLLSTRPLHDSGSNLEGLVDVSKLSDAVGIDGAITERGQVIALLQDQSDHLVLQPGLRDRATMSFYAEPGSWQEQVYKTLTLFTSFAETFSRRVFGHIFTGSDAPWQVKTMQWGSIMSALVVTNMMVVNLKQMAAGKPIYDPTDPKFYRDAIASAGALGIFTDWMKEAGIFDAFAGMAAFATGQEFEPEASFRSVSPLFGPAFGGVAQVGQGVISTLTALGSSDRDKVQGALRRLTDATFQQLPGQNIIWGRIVLRDGFLDGALDFIDPQGYREAKRRREKREAKGTVSLDNPLNIGAQFSDWTEQTRKEIFGY